MINRQTVVIGILSVFVLLVGAMLALSVKANPGSFFSNDKTVISVVIENSYPAREFHKGIEDALMVMEFPVEGLITRFVLLLDKDAMPAELGPVRSLRPYFVDAILPWSHAIFYAGGSPEAFERAYSHDELLPVNGLAHGKDFYRTKAPAPHNLFVKAESLLRLSEEVIYTIEWPPYKTGGMKSDTGATLIEIDYHSVSSNQTYAYEPSSETYTRTDGGYESAAHPSNVVVIEVPITDIGEFGRLTIPLKEGPLLLFRSGRMQKGAWKKTTISDGFQFFDEAGNELQLAKGQTWLTAVPNIDRVSWQ